MGDGPVSDEQSFVPNEESAERTSPREEALNLPSPSVSPHLATVVGSRSRSVAAVRREQLDGGRAQHVAQLVAIVPLVADDASRPGIRVPRCQLDHFLERRLDELRFPRRRGADCDSQRNALAADQYQALRALSTSGEADCVAPFFAAWKVASTKVRGAPVACAPSTASTASSSKTVV